MQLNEHSERFARGNGKVKISLRRSNGSKVRGSGGASAVLKRDGFY